jgi:spore coat polysaccharide biosynthesis protein SpsF
MSTRAGIILQARMGSQRLPGKTLEHVGGRSLLEQCVRRLMAADVGPVVLATTDRPEDDVLSVLARGFGAGVFRGAALDVLDRYAGCAARFGFDYVIRATGDNPCVDILAPRRVIDAMCETSADYVQEVNMPYGAAVEGVSRSALLQAAVMARDGYDREHVTPFVRRRTDLFQVVARQAPAPVARPDVRLTVDTPEDLRYVRELYFMTGTGMPALRDLIATADRVAGKSVA